ncbi:Hypothetical predicted protein [Mytilus galloprovincialis]|uniref:Uncharacterized protein n=1 Tax=Mytilus galloprovincialis TaxID=29158 RepID=A0A8B6HGP5_MYTGA|nr:Hypothetical predicted protein [Mytilus galloprovincialis]
MVIAGELDLIASANFLWNGRHQEITDCRMLTKLNYHKDYCFTECFDKNIIGNEYFAKLPWKRQEHDELPSNYTVTRRRTENVIKKLSQDPKLRKKYGDIIAEQERRGFVETVDEKEQKSGKIHYIPHHPIHKESSTTPIRIVYDCSCRKSPSHLSLNDCLMDTPPKLNDLTKLLVQFRANQFATCTDNEKAVLYVGLSEKDRDVTRFLWLSDPTNPGSQLKTYRFTAVLF